MEAGELKSFLRTGKDLGIQGLLENTAGNEVSRMIPLTKSSKTVDGDTSEHQERSLTLDLKPERPMSDNDEKPLNEAST